MQADSLPAELPGKPKYLFLFRNKRGKGNVMSVLRPEFNVVLRELEKEMATYSSILAWRIPGTEDLSGLLSVGSHRVGHY